VAIKLPGGLAPEAGILALHFAVWRFLPLNRENTLAAIRGVLFVALSYVLFASGLSPLHAAPAESSGLRHMLAQTLELVWWLQAAQLGIVLLDRVLLPGN
jgi:hypothetical protein